MTSYSSLSGELVELMRQAALDGDMRPAARLRRSKMSLMVASTSAENVGVSSMAKPPNVTYTHLLGASVPLTLGRDDYGFPLTEGLTLEQYRRMADAKTDSQTSRWSKLAVSSGFVYYPGKTKPKKAIRKGIPSALRPAVWFFYSGAQFRAAACEPAYYKDLAAWCIPSRIFELEMGQTFISNDRFGTLLVRSGTETDRLVTSRFALARVLLAYAKYHNATCIPGNLDLLASAFLLITEDEEKTFWLLVSHSAKGGALFCSPRSKACWVEQEVLWMLVEKKLPSLWKHFASTRLNLHGISASWLSSLFIEQLPFYMALRVLDVYLHEGPKVLLRTAIALLKVNKFRILGLHDPFELQVLLRRLPGQVLSMVDSNVFFDEILFEGLGRWPDEMVEKYRRRAEEKWACMRRPEGFDDGSILISTESTIQPSSSSSSGSNNSDDDLVNSMVTPPKAMPKARRPTSAGPTLPILSISPPRFRLQPCHVSPAHLSPLAEEDVEYNNP